MVPDKVQRRPNNAGLTFLRLGASYELICEKTTEGESKHESGVVKE